eukprot:16445208-Heterocapsa_arctica.AAC.1
MMGCLGGFRSSCRWALESWKLFGSPTPPGSSGGSSGGPVALVRIAGGDGGLGPVTGWGRTLGSSDAV